MALVREDVRQEEWEFFNSLNIQFEGKHKTANKYSKWVTDRERDIVFTTVRLAGRDYGDTYILIWENARVYIYVESRLVVFEDGSQEYQWYIESITAPIALKNKRDELLELVKNIANVNYERRDAIDCISPTKFVVVTIAEPRFVEGV